MFTKTIIFASAVASVVYASPVASTSQWTPNFGSSFDGSSRPHVSLNNWGGIPSLYCFDNFYGVGNFAGFHNDRAFVSQEQNLVCRSQSIEIVQQRLTVLREMAKRIISQQVCEVEVQTFALQQFTSGLHDFSGDLRRKHGKRHVAFDREVASHVNVIVDERGELTKNDFGFKGSDVGSHLVRISGDNWNDASSPSSVTGAYFLSRWAGASSSF